MQEYISMRIAVPPSWEQVFSHFYYAANHSNASIEKQLLPAFQSIMAFNFGPPVPLEYGGETFLPIEKTLVLGPVKQSMKYTMLPGSKILVANFKDDAFYRFFGKPLQHYLADPDKLIQTHCFADLWQELQVMEDPALQVKRLLDFSGEYLCTRDPAAANIIEDGLNDSPKQIAGRSGQSERTVQLNYKKYLGFSSKEMNRYQRFQKAIGMLVPGEVPDWFEVIEVCGYYDQSHLIKDFTHFVGVSPQVYLQLQQVMCRAGS
ncbi:AraC family transcriptional regulator [Chitinophaga sp.]|uniref:helix-turn-helix domain-containing protein n=1 Tax=Chitinophaga sp. TaxID=1869181 RepID=UPI0031D5179A